MNELSQNRGPSQQTNQTNILPEKTNNLDIAKPAYHANLVCPSRKFPTQRTMVQSKQSKQETKVHTVSKQGKWQR